HPVLRPPRDMPRRRNFGAPAGRVALLHALAHIELNAIDLAWDLVARFSDSGLPHEFFDDWLGVAAEEAEHFALLASRLQVLCHARGLDPEAAFHDRVGRYFKGVLKPPFNREARDQTGLPAAYYERLAGSQESPHPNPPPLAGEGVNRARPIDNPPLLAGEGG